MSLSNITDGYSTDLCKCPASHSHGDGRSCANYAETNSSGARVEAYSTNTLAQHVTVTPGA